MALDRATILQRNNNDFMRPYRQRLDTPLLNRDSEIRVKFKERVEGLGVKEDAIQADRARSPEGKLAARGKLVNDSLPTLEFLPRVTADLEGEATAIRATLFAIKLPSSLGSDPLLQYLRSKELRDEVKGLSQPARDSRFLQAAETDDEELLWALTDAPNKQLVTEEVRTRALEERANRREPQAFRRVQQLEVLREELGGLRDHLVLWLRELGGDQKRIFDSLGGPEPEPNTMQAGKMVAA